MPKKQQHKNKTKHAYFPRTHNLLVSQNTTQWHFFSTIHPLSPVIFANAIVVAFVLLRNSRFSFHCYTQRGATPTQISARKWRCDLSQLRTLTKGINSCKPASLNRPIRYSIKRLRHIHNGEARLIWRATRSEHTLQHNTPTTSLASDTSSHALQTQLSCFVCYQL